MVQARRSLGDIQREHDEKWVRIGHEWAKVWQEISFTAFCKSRSLNQSAASAALKRLGYNLSVKHRGSWKGEDLK